jgi:hypothetical protein
MIQKQPKGEEFGLGKLPDYAINQVFDQEISTTKEEFENLLKKACEQKPKPSTKSSKT